MEAYLYVKLKPTAVLCYYVPSAFHYSKVCPQLTQFIGHGISSYSGQNKLLTQKEAMHKENPHTVMYFQNAWPHSSPVRLSKGNRPKQNILRSETWNHRLLVHFQEWKANCKCVIDVTRFCPLSKGINPFSQRPERFCHHSTLGVKAKNWLTNTYSFKPDH